MKNFIKKYIYELGLGCVIVIFCIIKAGYWNLPFYWDEAWVYGPAMRSMAERIPSLLPDALSSDLSRGHPLLFSFLGGWWLRLFGNSVANAHIFATLISVLYLISIYLITKNIRNGSAGLFAIILVIAQPVFLAQSGMALPEIMVGLLSLLSLYYGYKQYWVWCSMTLTAVLLTKESGIVALLSVYLVSFADDWKHQNFNLKKFVLLLIPLLVFVGFFMLQKLMLGWYFFPEHTSLIDLSYSGILDKFSRYFSFVFIYQGRNVLFFAGLGCLIYFIYKNKPLGKPHSFLLASVIFIMGYLLFSSINFFSARYSISVMIPFLIGFAVMIDKTIENKIIKSAAIVGLIIHFLFINIQRQDNSDHTSGYLNCVSLQHEAVQYLEQNQLTEKKIYAGFLMRTALTQRKAGYTDAIFENVVKTQDDDCEYYIYSNFEGVESIKIGKELKKWTRNGYEIAIYKNQ